MPSALYSVISFNLGNTHVRWALLQMGKQGLRELEELRMLVYGCRKKTEPQACLAPRPVSAPLHLTLHTVSFCCLFSFPKVSPVSPVSDLTHPKGHSGGASQSNGRKPGVEMRRAGPQGTVWRGGGQDSSHIPTWPVPCVPVAHVAQLALLTS